MLINLVVRVGYFDLISNVLRASTTCSCNLRNMYKTHLSALGK